MQSEKKYNYSYTSDTQKYVYENRRFVNKSALAETLHISQRLVDAVISGKRKDYYNILETAEKIIRVQI